MGYYIRDGVDLKEVPLHKVETLMNAGITIISDKDIIKELKQQLEDAFEVMNTIERMEEDEEYPATRISKAAKMCRQFILKLKEDRNDM